MSWDSVRNSISMSSFREGLGSSAACSPKHSRIYSIIITGKERGERGVFANKNSRHPQTKQKNSAGDLDGEGVKKVVQAGRRRGERKREGRIGRHGQEREWSARTKKHQILGRKRRIPCARTEERASERGEGQSAKEKNSSGSSDARGDRLPAAEGGITRERGGRTDRLQARKNLSTTSVIMNRGAAGGGKIKRPRECRQR